MIKVHVWDSAWARYLPGSKGEGSPGHAAIAFGTTYVSFWPGEAAGLLKWKGHKLKTLDEDLANYKKYGQAHWEQEIPSGASGLSEELMLARWIDIQSKNPDYTKSFQCSAVVNELLIAGGSRKFLVNAWYRPATWVIAAVSPADVKDYVTALVKAMKGRK